MDGWQDGFTQYFQNLENLEKNWQAAQAFPSGQHFVEPPIAAITAARLLGYVSILFVHLYPDILGKISQELSEWMETMFFATDSQLDWGLGDHWHFIIMGCFV